MQVPDDRPAAMSSAEGAQRMATGNQRYIWLAEQSPQWALMTLGVAAAAPELLPEIRDYVLADLLLEVKQKAFRITSEAAAMDLINGTIAQAMRSVGLAGATEPWREVVTCVLRGLGMEARRPRRWRIDRCRRFRRSARRLLRARRRSAGQWEEGER